MELVTGICTLSRNASAVVASCFKHVWDEHKPVLFAVIAVASAVKLHRVVKYKKLREKWDSAGENVAVVHGLGRARTCPNLSPFVVKLETYLRMAGIKYQYDSDHPWGPKAKTPWITFNGQDYTDSQLIMEFLGNKFNKNFSSSLTSDQKAVARAMAVMTDEHILWGLVWWRFLKNFHIFFELMNPSFSKLVFPVVKWKISRVLWMQGLGRHSHSEIIEIIRKDVESLSLYLGDKSFLMGDTPCEVDCAVFGMVCQFVWGLPGSPFEAMVKNDYPNLVQYCLRMKQKFWPDWDTNLLK